MRPKTPKKVKPGEPITARAWNDLVDLVIRGDINVGQSSGLDFIENADGTALRVRKPADTYLAVANGNIPARSDSAAGVGQAYLVYVTPTYSGGTLTAVALTTSTVSFKVYNPSSAKMTSGNGIDSGQYCMIREYPTGLWLVWPLECS